MKWRRRDHGDIRVVKKFAILPISCGYEVRWLEICYVKQQYDVYNDYWHNMRFLTRGEANELKVRLEKESEEGK